MVLEEPRYDGLLVVNMSVILFMTSMSIVVRVTSASSLVVVVLGAPLWRIIIKGHHTRNFWSNFVGG